MLLSPLIAWLHPQDFGKCLTGFRPALFPEQPSGVIKKVHGAIGVQLGRQMKLLPRPGALTGLRERQAQFMMRQGIGGIDLQGDLKIPQGRRYLLEM